jgi:hypothetical protein
MPVALLASRVGVDRSTLFSWLAIERQPHPLQLLLLVQETELPLQEVATAASVPLERALRQRAVLFNYVAWEMGQSAIVTADERRALLSRLRDVRDASLDPPDGEQAYPDDSRDAVDAATGASHHAADVDDMAEEKSVAEKQAPCRRR